MVLLSKATFVVRALFLETKHCICSIGKAVYDSSAALKACDNGEREAYSPQVWPDVHSSKVNGVRSHVLSEVLSCNAKGLLCQHVVTDSRPHTKCTFCMLQECLQVVDQ